MAAILRSGKFLRLFSGVARNLVAGQGQGEDGVAHPGLVFDKSFSQANFSIQNVLPYIGVSDSGHAEDRFPTRLVASTNSCLGLGRVTKEEIEIMLMEIEATEPDIKTGTLHLLSSQALLAIRLVISVCIFSPRVFLQLIMLCKHFFRYSSAFQPLKGNIITPSISSY